MKEEEDIKKDIVDQLYWDSRVDASKVKVEVDENKAILTGTVLTYSEKVAAANVTWSVGGVKSVNNRLEVEFPSTFTVPTDEEIDESVKQRLIWNTDVISTDVTVEVEAGIVTLSGSVGSYWQKISAESEAEKVNGVLSVVNKLVVVPTEKIDDEMIGERIVKRIEENTDADIDQMDVRVEDGKVHLSGNVGSWVDWRGVYDAVQYTSGVVEIEDNLNIKYM